MALKDVLKKVADSYDNVAATYKAGNQQSENLGKELAEKIKMKREADKALNPPAAPPAPKPAPKVTAPMDKVNPKGAYGDKPGEKRIDVSDMVKPLGKMHDGGEIKKSGAYELQKGEHVLTAPQKSMLGLAAHAMSHAAGDKQPDEPKKEIKEMHIRRGASGGHIVKHIHANFQHPDEEHVVPHTDALVDHVIQHFTDPDEGEEEAESTGEADDGGKEAMEKAVGYE